MLRNQLEKQHCIPRTSELPTTNTVYFQPLLISKTSQFNFQHFLPKTPPMWKVCQDIKYCIITFFQSFYEQKKMTDSDCFKAAQCQCVHNISTILTSKWGGGTVKVLTLGTVL